MKIEFHLKNCENMLTKRIIPCLDVKDGRTVKGVNFVNLVDAGDPVEQAERYANEGADELVFLDISATQEKRKTLALMVEAVASKVNIPFTVGGGIQSLEDAEIILNAGADKIAINSAAVKNPNLINQLSDKYGNQCIVLAVDAKRIDGIWRVFLAGGTIQTDLELFDWCAEGVERGAGEILFTSMENDGVKSGFSIRALKSLTEKLNVPVIASGGAGSIKDFEDVFKIAEVDAALAASVFHFGEIKIENLKSRLINAGIPIRK